MTKPIATPQDFKAKANRTAILDLPSGATIQVRNPGGLKVFMKNGMIPNSLLPMVQEAINGGKGFDASDLMTEGKLDLGLVNDMMRIVDEVTMECWVMPPVLPAPEDEASRDDELLYVDEVLEDDKMFVFQWVTGGTRDLATFRKEQAAALDGLAGVADAGETTE
ncbi:MAG: hypothetical protein LC687_04965 [Actinobacteria bacterium]|nr:hypothetical protein [Actinomycetota bacterium]MCA1807185.1 hypothetical protein [Actinomycetota bacterium]